MPDTPKTFLEALQEVELGLPVALSLIATIKNALASGNGSMTVDELIADAEAGWDKAQKDLDVVAKQGHG